MPRGPPRQSGGAGGEGEQDEGAEGQADHDLHRGKPRSAIAIHKKLEPKSKASKASRARLPRPTATGYSMGAA